MATFVLPLGAIAPISTGLIMAYRDNGRAGLKELIRRGFDFKRIKKRIWYFPIILLLPLIFATAFGILVLFKQSIPEAPSPVFLVPILFLSFFILGFGEEVGWMGYAFDSIQNKSGSRKATILLALIWPLWHLPLYNGSRYFTIRGIEAKRSWWLGKKVCWQAQTNDLQRYIHNS